MRGVGRGGGTVSKCRAKLLFIFSQSSLPSREDAGLEGLAHLDALDVGFGQGRRVGGGVVDENLDGQSLNLVSLPLRNALQGLEL